MASTVRDKIVEFGQWGINHAGKIHYAEIRPIPQVKTGVPPKLPFTTDCSGFATMCYQYAGAPDPNGNNYDGSGYTGTLMTHGTKVKVPLPGDLIVYGTYPGHHVVVYMRTWHGAWLVASHGDEHGPVLELQHREQIVQPSPMQIRSYLPRI